MFEVKSGGMKSGRYKLKLTLYPECSAWIDWGLSCHGNDRKGFSSKCGVWWKAAEPLTNVLHMLFTSFYSKAQS